MQIRILRELLQKLLRIINYTYFINMNHMKINKYLLYLLFVPALSMTSCSDFEDTEVASPQADQDALGG